MNQLNEQQRQTINAEIFGGRKIEAIKHYREATGCQLIEAKQAVEGMEKELRQREPNKFATPAGKAGCMGVMAVVTLLIGGALVTTNILHS